MNEGKRDVLIFPKFKNIDKLQDIRIKYDSLANIVPPHITLAFPFWDNISNEDLSRKIKEIACNIKPFQVIFKGITLSKDNYIFLNCKSGCEEIIKLHDNIYKNILNNHNSAKIKYIPHITLGKAKELGELQDFNYTFTTVIDEIVIELIGEKEESIVVDNIKIENSGKE